MEMNDFHCFWDLDHWVKGPTYKGNAYQDPDNDPSLILAM